MFSKEYTMKRLTKLMLPVCALLLIGVVGCDLSQLQGIFGSQQIQDLFGQVLTSVLGGA
jgi:hypothetical protein